MEQHSNTAWGHPEYLFKDSARNEAMKSIMLGFSPTLEVPVGEVILDTQLTLQ